MKPMTNEIRNKIDMYRKNGLDISSLIDGVNIKGEDLRRCVIKNFNRNNEDLKGTKFSYATIGEEGKVLNISNNNFVGSEFIETKFIGKIFLRRCNCSSCNFNGAWMQNVEYQGTDFRKSDFCEAVIRLGSSYGLKAKFDENLFKDLAKHWNIQIIIKPDEE